MLITTTPTPAASINKSVRARNTYTYNDQEIDGNNTNIGTVGGDRKAKYVKSQNYLKIN